MRQHTVQLADQVVLQILAFPDPGLHESFRGASDCFLQQLPEFILVQCLLLHAENLRISGQGGHPDIIFQRKVLRHPVEIQHILRCKFLIVFHAHIRLREILIGNKKVYLPPLDMVL